MDSTIPKGVADLAALHRPAGEARGLPGAAYTDQDFFDWERERLFARSWVCAGVGAELPAVGDQRPVTVAGRPILLLRDEAGAVRAYHNVCRHRGVELVDQPAKGKRVVCPYHAWSYGLDGALLRTPNAGGPGVHACEGLERDALGLVPVRTDMWADFIFVDISGKAPLLEDWLAPMTERWQAYDLSLLRHGGHLDFELGANWKLALENALEYYHLPMIHPALNSYSPIEKHAFELSGDRFIGAISTNYRCAEVAGTRLPVFPDLDPALAEKGDYPVVFPNLFLGIQSDHLFALVITPEGPARTHERFHLYYVGDAALGPDYQPVREAVTERWREINGEDVAIIERLQRGHASPGFDGGFLSPVQDHATHHFLKMVADRLGAED